MKRKRYFLGILFAAELLILAAMAGKTILTERYAKEFLGETIPTGETTISLGSGYYVLDIYYTAEADGLCRLMANTSYGQVNKETIYLTGNRDHIQTDVLLTESANTFFLQIEDRETTGIVLSGFTVRETSLGDVRLCFLLACFFLLLDLFLILRDKGVGKRMETEQKQMVLGLCVACLLASTPLFLNYLVVSTGDAQFHLMRIEGLADAIRSGEFPVKMQASWLAGYGFPASVMYGDLLLYLPVILRLVGFPLQSAYQIYCLFINILTVLSSYFCIKAMTQSRKIGLLGSILYAWASYRLTIMYVTGAMDEFTAMAFFPLILLGLYLLFEAEETKKACICLTVGYTMVLQAHMISFAMAVLILILYCVLHPGKLLKRIPVLAKSAGITLLLNLGFVLPRFDYLRTQDLAAKIMESDIRGTQSHGLFFPQLFQMFEYQGTLSSAVGSGMADDMPLSLGLPFLLVLVLWVMEACAFGRVIKQEFTAAVWKEQICIFVMLLLSLWMSSYLFPWTIIRKIPVIGTYLVPYQYAWCFLGAATVFGIILAGFALKNLVLIARPEIRTAVVWGIVVVAVLNVTYFTNYIVNTSWVTTVVDAGGIHPLLSLPDVRYLPVWTDTGSFDISCISGDGVTVESLILDGEDYVVTCANTSDIQSYVTIPRLFYKGYVATDIVSGEVYGIANGENNRIQISLPAGYMGSIRIAFRQPILWRISELISVAAFFVCIFFWYRSKGGQVVDKKAE